MSEGSLKIGMFSFCHPSDNTVGGANVTSRLSGHFRELGHEVWVYYPLKEPLPPGPELWNGVHAVPLRFRDRIRGPLGLEKEISRKMASSLHPDMDVVIVNNEFGAFFNGNTKGGNGKVPKPLKVVALHGIALHFMERGRLSRGRSLRKRLGYWLDVWALKPLERRSLERADLLIACSGMVRDDAHRTYDVPLDRVHVVYNGVTVQSARTPEAKLRARESLGLAQSDCIVSFVGRDPDRKGLAVAKGAIRSLRSEGMAITLLNVGNDSSSEEGVVSLGKVTEETKDKVLMSSDMFVLPTMYEGFPAVIQEAAALGVPVLTSCQSGLDIGTPGKDYALVRENTREAFAATIRELLDDRERLARMGESGRLALGSRSYMEQAHDYLRLFEAARRASS
jgi:glycosyltransferase involved in cell wall biosynthesis